jgi:hypothetical protein
LFHILIFVKVQIIFAINDLTLGEEADSEALNCMPALNLMRITELHITTETAFILKAFNLLCFSLVCYHLASRPQQVNMLMLLGLKLFV